MTTGSQSLPPLLPNFDTWHPEDDRPLYSYEQMLQYGDARAAHARKQAMEDAAKIARETCHHEATVFSDGFNRAALNIEIAIKELK
jgi:hypothetical protein